MTLTQADRKALITAMRDLYTSGGDEYWARLQRIFMAYGVSVTLSPRVPHHETFGWSRTVYVYADQLEVIGFYPDSSDPFPKFCVRHFIYERRSWRNLWSPGPLELHEYDDGPWWYAVRSLTTLIQTRVTELRALVAHEVEIREKDSALRSRLQGDDRIAQLRRAYKE